MSEENEKKQGAKVDGHKLIMTFIFICVTAVIFLAIGFVAGKNSATTEEKTASESATTVTSDETESTATTAAATGSATATNTASWKTYTNSKYGFTLTFTDKWKGYEVIDFRESGTGEAPAPAEDQYEVYAPTSSTIWSTDKKGYASIFKINVYDKTVFENILKSNDDPYINSNGVIAENGKYVFFKSTGQDYPEDLQSSGLLNEISSVTKSIKFKD